MRLSNPPPDPAALWIWNKAKAAAVPVPESVLPPNAPAVRASNHPRNSNANPVDMYVARLHAKAASNKLDSFSASLPYAPLRYAHFFLQKKLMLRLRYATLIFPPEKIDSSNDFF